MCQCAFCDEPIRDAVDEARMVFGELLHAECETQLFAELDAAIGLPVDSILVCDLGVDEDEIWRCDED